jgi:hypothetical protein
MLPNPAKIKAATWARLRHWLRCGAFRFAKVAEREGFEPLAPSTEVIDGKNGSGSRQAASFPTASPKPDNLWPDLAEVVKKWPNLSTSLRSAILAIVVSAKGAREP